MRKTLLTVLCPLTVFLWPSVVDAQEIQWRTDYAAARKEAEKKGLPLVLDIGTENCFWCRRLDESTFREAAVVRLMNEQFIPLRIDANKEEKLTQVLQVQGFPTLIFASPSGKILSSFEGYQDAQRFLDSLHRVLANFDNPEWMLRDHQLAAQAIGKNDYARAVKLLRSILQDGKSRPIQVASDKLLKNIEEQAQGRLLQAKQLQQQGNTQVALEAFGAVEREFAGTTTAREAVELVRELTKNSELITEQRSRRAKDLLEQARRDYQSQQFLPALDRCETLRMHYGDLPEALQAMQLTEELKTNPEWLQSACATLSERLGGLYRALAESWISRGQLQQARQCLEQVIRAFPGSRHAEAAQQRLNGLSDTSRRVEYNPH